MELNIIKYIDNLIESQLTNIKSFDSPNNNERPDFASMFDNDINKPIVDFLDAEEKEEEEKIKFNNKIKGIDTDTNRRKVRDTDINSSKQAIQKINKLRDELKAQQEKIRQQQQLQLKMQAEKEAEIQSQQQYSEQIPMEEIRQQIKTHIKEMFDGMPDINKYDSLPIITRKNHSFEPVEESSPFQAPVPAPIASNVPSNIPAPKKKIIKVTFDSKTGNPFQAEFTERGFLIGSTRLSFEVIETALSKNFTITLDGGNGLVLDAIKMQKILKYKDKI